MHSEPSLCDTSSDLFLTMCLCRQGLRCLETHQISREMTILCQRRRCFHHAFRAFTLRYIQRSFFDDVPLSAGIEVFGDSSDLKRDDYFVPATALFPPCIQSLHSAIHPAIFF